MSSPPSNSPLSRSAGSRQINELTRIAREESDFASDQFMQWFIKRQVESYDERAYAVVRRSKDNIEAVEDYIQREQEGTRPTPRPPALRDGEPNRISRARKLRLAGPAGQWSCR